VDVSRIDDLRHVAEEERQQQRLDMRTVDIGISHRDDLVIPALRDVEVVSDTGADRGDDRLDLFVLEDLGQSGPLDVEDLAPKRKNGLELALTRLFRATACRVTLDDQ
jgi:hypothetical protein